MSQSPPTPSISLRESTFERWAVLALSSVVAATCGLRPPPTVVETRGGLDVSLRVDRETYRPTDLVQLSLENRGMQPVFVDTACGFFVEGERSPGYWSGSLGSGGCFSYGGPIVVEIFEVAPGETVRATAYAGSYDSSWRIHFCLLDRDGEPLLGAPTHSPVFQVRGGPRLDQRVRRSVLETDTLEFMRRQMERHDVCMPSTADSLVVH